MRNDTVERVSDWESEPFNDGYDGLRELADREFTGAATDGHAWLFMLNGRVLGVFDGSMGSFESADGTAYEAPDPALPLLFAMQETGGETRAEYYSEETAIAEVDRTLQSGNFTGYIELSDNVLSGDYYVAYYGGRSLPAAFVGNNAELLTEDEAFERADDEVGIYQVNTVDLDITDIPEPASSTAAAGADPSDPNGGTDAVEQAEPEPEEQSPAEPDESPSTGEPDESPSTGEPDESPSTGEPERTEPTRESEPEPEPEPEPERAEPTAVEPTNEEPDAAADEPAEPTTEASTANTQRTPVKTRESEQRSTAEPAETPPEPEPEPVGTGGPAEQWHGAKTIPALDPAESVDMADEVDEDIEAQPVSEAATATAAAGRPAPNSEVVEELKAERDRLQERVEELEAETERLEGENERLERERDEARARVSELEQEIDELESTVDRLERELATAEEELAAAEKYIPEGDHDVGAEQALAGTNLFVRYDRQGGPTLEDAYEGNAGREEVNGNLRLEHHTEFEDDGAIVDGEPFDE
jgi:outer membrane murein-binding lipoprotein Lpp